MSLLFKSSVRHLVRHPLSSAFNVLAIALGVGVYLAVQVANYSATSAFRAGLDLVSGKSHLEVRGNGGKVDENLIPEVGKLPGVKASTPLLQGFVTLDDYPGEFLRILGVDVFSNGEFQTAPITGISGARNLEAFLASSGQVALNKSFADSRGIKAGDEIRVKVNTRPAILTAALIVEGDAEDNSAADNVATMDIGWAQELFGRVGEVTTIQIILEDTSEMDSVSDVISEILPAGTSVAPPARRGSQVEGMLAGFQLNLTALSMVSILVGVFLIYNTASASVVRRRREIGILRSLGASRARVAGMFLLEAAVLGLLGALIGVPAGMILASLLVEDVGKTISTLYILVSIGDLSVSWGYLVLAFCYGLIAAVVGAWVPAREAASTDPAHALSTGRTANPRPVRAGWMFGLGLIINLAATAASWGALVGGPPWLSFVACFLLVAGFSLMVPLIARGVARLLGKLLRGVHVGRTACDNMDRSLHRSAITIAALMAAVSMMAGVSIMISSFRGTMDSWISRTVVADVFVAPAANEVIGLEATVPPELREWLQEQPGVSAVDSFFEYEIALGEDVYSIGVVDGSPRGNLSFLGGRSEERSAAWFEKDRVIVNEAFSRKVGVRAGDLLEIPAAGEEVEFKVEGVYYDYSDDRGQILMTRGNFDRYWTESGYHSLVVYVEEDADMDSLIASIATQHSSGGELAVYKNAQLRERIFAIFDQTFAVTYVLRTIAIAVAAIGVFLTLSTLVAERAREIAVYRSIGSSRNQVATSHLAEAGLSGFVSGLVGIVCGVGLAMVLTWVVNKAYFGWTIQFSIPWGELLIVPAWLTVVAAISGLIPALRAANVPIAPGLRTE